MSETYLLVLIKKNDDSNRDIRERRCRFKCAVRVNLAGHSVQYFVFGRMGTLPLCSRILESGASVVEKDMKQV